jgi:hypothetical protein
MDLVKALPIPPRVVVMDIGATSDLDVATTDMLSALHTDLHDSLIELRLAQVRGSVRDRMRRTGLMEVIGERHCYLSDEAAIAAPLPGPPSTAAPAPDAPPPGEPTDGTLA